ncbi:MAG: outer membrane efflux protein [uncultured bacterium]|nr:MAG: outer membrane efflux protein [uncultured bacterium]HBY01640.1 TolC family protein [Rikenellaceae bacterium]
MRYIKLYFTIAVLFIFSAVNAGAQTAAGRDTLSLTLERCIERTLEANYSIVISENNLEIVRNNVTLAPFMPYVSVGSRQSSNNMQQRNFTQDGDIEKSTSKSNSIINSATLNWRLFDGFSMFAERSKQESLLLQGENNFKSVLENLVMQISVQYYLIISLQNQVNLLDELVSISQIRYNQALTRYNIGSDSGLEYKQAKIYLNSDMSRLLLQKENLKNAYIELYRLMNLPLNSVHSIKDSIIPEPQMVVADLISSAIENNTTLKGIKAGEQIAKLDTKIARASRYPVLDFSTGYNYNFNQSQYFPSKFNESNGLNWGLSLSIPIFDGNEINRKIKNARITEENASLNYLKARQEIESELYQLYNIYSNNLRMIEFEDESRESAFLNLEAAMEKYRLGALSGIEFRDIQLSYMDASDRRLKAIYQAKVSEITLHLMAGELFRSR